MLFLSKNNDSVKKMFDDFFDFPIVNFDKWMRADVREEKDAYLFDVEMPGFDKENIKISVDNDYLIIEAEKNEVNDDNNKYIVRERRYGKVERSFYVGKVDEANIKANYNNGILTINVPKAIEAEKKYIMIE